MWFGTQNGLNRYDGNTIRIFEPVPHLADQLSNSDIYALHEDRSGALWIGTADGLNRFDRATERFTAYLHDPDDGSTLGPGQVTAIYEDSDSVLWVGTSGGGISYLDRTTGKFTRFPFGRDDPDALSNGFVHVIFEDRAGRLWIGVDGGVNALNRQSSRFTHMASASSNADSSRFQSVLAIEQDASGALWFGTDGGGLVSYSGNAGGFTRYSHNLRDPSSLAHNTVSSIHEDRRGVLWIGTDGGGLQILDRATGEFTQYRTEADNPESLVDDRVLAIAEDQSGVMWVGTYGRGVDRFDTREAKFTAYSSRPGTRLASGDFVRTFLVDRNGELWIGIEDGGISRINRETGNRTLYLNDPANPHSLNNNRVFSIHEDRQGAIWIGTGGGLNRFNRSNETFRRYSISTTDSVSGGSAAVRAILEDRNEQLWLATDGAGLYLFDRETGRTVSYSHDPGNAETIGANRIFSLLESQFGVLWVGTFGGGLNSLDRATGKFTRFTNVRGDTNSLSNDHVLTIFEDPSGKLWIGTNGGGLDGFDPETQSFTNYGEADGLVNNTVYGIIGDDSGYLWLSHNSGLTRFNPASEAFRHFDVSHGLQSNEFNGGAYYRSTAGEIFFGGINGYNAFFPDSIKNDPRLPPVVITDLQFYDKSVPIGEGPDGRTVLTHSISETDELTLSYRDRAISFEYTALFYGSTDQNEYSYMMEGLDEEWINAGVRRFTTYARIPPGRYTFRVKASNGDGVWNEDGTSLQVRVLPPIWMTWWFIAFATVCVILSIWGLHRYRTRLIRVRSNLLEESIQERTVELEREISERRQVQRQLARAHRAALQATQSKSDFLANMSHEIRTPMNGVLGMVQLLMDTDLNSEQYDYAKTIRASGDALLGIINDILDFSKVEAGRLEIEPIPFDLQVAVSEVADLLSPRAAQQGIELALQYHPDAPRYLVGDAGRIRQVILNLAGNAIKFTNEGHVLIEIRGLPSNGDEAAVKILVHDTGIGIDASVGEKLFQSFSQADASTTRKFGGTGLGLAISKRLVELMGGEIGVESVLGEGSVFWFTLRLARTQPTGTGPVPDVDLSHLRILAVDDLEVNRRILYEQLRSLGMRPDVASSAEEALEMLRDGEAARDPYAVAVLDFQMPDMNGEQLGKLIKADKLLSDIALVLFTSSGQRGDAKRMSEVGFAGYLTKTTSVETMRDVLATVWADSQSGRMDVRLVTQHSVAEARAASGEPTVENPDNPERRVLIAEDNIVNQKVAKRMLEKLGCVVDVAANGEEAVDMWSKLPYDVVFMDCQMPELDGYAATGRIRERESAGAHTPIVAMTANAMEGDRERCLSAGMDDYMAKPIRIELCREVLERCEKVSSSENLIRDPVS